MKNLFQITSTVLLFWLTIPFPANAAEPEVIEILSSTDIMGNLWG